MKLLFMTNVPSPYRVDFFNELGKYCDLTVTFEKTTSNERDKSWSDYQFQNFKGIFLKGKSINTDTAICFEIKKVIKNGNFDKIICANFTSPTGMIAIRYMRKKKIKYWLESDGGFAKNGKGFKEKLKKYLIKGAEGYLSTGKAHDEYYLMYGAEKERIHRYPFTSIHESYVEKAVSSAEEKLALREKLQIPEEKVVLAVGQFIYRKGFDVLLKAAIELPKNVGFYFVGGTPTKEYLDLREANGLSNVHFVGFKDKQALKEYYRAADLFAFPTREDIWGLVVNEAMANGLPVITTDKCVAGLELVKEGENGYLVPTDDVKALKQGIEKIFATQENVTLMGEKSLEIISNYTIESMVKRHLEILR